VQPSRCKFDDSIFPRVGRWAMAGTLLLAAFLPLAAQQSRFYQEGDNWVEEISGTLAPSDRDHAKVRNLIIKLDSGDVAVQGRAEGTISYVMKKRVRASSETDARQQLARYRFTVTKKGETATLDSNEPGHRHSVSELSVWVPRSMAWVKAVSQGGNVALGNFQGKADAATGGGNIRLDEIGGPASAASGGGDVTVGVAHGDLALRTGGGNINVNTVQGNLTINTGGGNITIGSAARSVTAATGGGSIDVKKCGGHLVASTGGGNLELGQMAGEATVQTGGGSIRLNSANGLVTARTTAGAVELFGLTRGAKVQSGSGQLVAEFLGADFAESSLQTPSGDIVVYLGPNLRTTVRAAVELAEGHYIQSDFPEIKINTEGGNRSPKSAFAEGSLNGGGPTLKVRTTTGDITFRRAKK
jgi:DUF4097 and DUF4098 domain-containing protein YvlB